MGRIVLRATAFNRGLKGSGSWAKEVWKVWDEGSWYREIVYVPEEGSVPSIHVGKLSKADFEELKREMGKPWPEERVDVLDGVAWRFTTYNDIGAQEKFRLEGYVEGMEPFESMIWILRKQVGKDM